jgi:hypothetical protein
MDKDKLINVFCVGTHMGLISPHMYRATLTPGQFFPLGANLTLGANFTIWTKFVS